MSSQKGYCEEGSRIVSDARAEVNRLGNLPHTNERNQKICQALADSRRCLVTHIKENRCAACSEEHRKYMLKQLAYINEEWDRIEKENEDEECIDELVEALDTDEFRQDLANAADEFLRNSAQEN